MNNLHDDLKNVKAAAGSMPPPDKIAAVLDHISKGAPYDQLFFENLTDSAWLPVLDHRGFFSNLPGLKTVEGIGQVYPFHLPLVGLARLAPHAPNAVTATLARLEIPENPTVGDQILRCITFVREPSCIPVLQSILVRLSEKSKGSSWIWIQELLKNWIELEAYEDVLIVINSYLLASICASAASSEMHDAWLVRQVDELALDKLTPSFPLQIATIVFNALARFAINKRSLGAGETESTSFDVEDYFGENASAANWLTDFNSVPNHSELGQTLAHRLFIASDIIYKNGKTHEIELLDQLLRSNSWKLFQRLRWQQYASYPDLSAPRARKDVIERIPFLNRYKFQHAYEFAQTIRVHAKQHAEAFLSAQEVNQFFDVVMSGPVEEFRDTGDDHFKKYFRLKQLWPLSSLLQGIQLSAFNILCSECDPISIESYKPFSSGSSGARFIEKVPPSEAANLGAMSDERLWEMLNHWQPGSKSTSDWWIQEDMGALAKSFAELVEKDPQRFLAATKWWENLSRPQLLLEPLNRATERIKKKYESGDLVPSDIDWENWFGVADWIMLKLDVDEDGQKADAQEAADRRDYWYAARIAVSHFLTGAIQSDYTAVNRFRPEMERLLRALVEREDSHLDGKVDNEYDDWLTIAINSVRGTAIEGIIALALKQKNAKEEIQPWIFKFISSRLRMQNESPAIFAIFGARLRLFVYLFKQHLKETPELLLPPERPLQGDATIVSHFNYDAPMTDIIELFPDLLERAVSILESARAATEHEDFKKRPHDFSSQLGIHAAFYYWNSAFRNDKEGETILDRFFHTVKSGTRAALISEIGGIFEKAPPPGDVENEKRFSKVMRFWDRRYEQITEALKTDESSINEYDGELGQFLNWLNCECFPFEWRFRRAMEAVSNLKRAPEVFHLMETLHRWEGKFPERLGSVLQILEAIVAKPSDKFLWSIQTEKIGPILARGLSDTDPAIQLKATECQNTLLKLGRFEFLDFGGK